MDELYIVSPALKVDPAYLKLKEVRGKKKYYSLICDSDTIAFLSKKVSNRPNVRKCILFDDCMTDEGTRIEQFGKLVVMARHNNCSILLTTQLFNGISTTARNNCELFIGFRNGNWNEVKAIHGTFGEGRLKTFYDTFTGSLTSRDFCFIKYRCPDCSDMGILNTQDMQINNFI